MHTHRAGKGYIMMEVVVSAFLLGALALVYTQLGRGVTTARDRQLTVRALQLAAEAQLERYRAGAAIQPSMSIDTLPNGTIETQVEPGQGDWQGMRLVTVTARGTARGGRQVSVTLRAYLPEEARR